MCGATNGDYSESLESHQALSIVPSVSRTLRPQCCVPRGAIARNQGIEVIESFCDRLPLLLSPRSSVTPAIFEVLDDQVRYPS
jgi:hypothetical protein